MSQTRIQTKEEFAEHYGDFDPSKEPKMLAERLDGTLARAMAADDPKASRKDGQAAAFKAAYGGAPEEETLDDLRARLVARLDATSWARNEFSDERVAKQVIVVRTDLKMRKGKIAAQAAHAAMKVLLDRVQRPAVTSFGETRAVARPHPGFADRYDNPGAGVPWDSVMRGDITIPLNAPMMDWLMGRFTKVCCRIESEEELLRICDAALKARLSCALIQDSGKTEFGGVPTLTCCAIGPAYPKDIDPVTAHLKLL
jgi:PTH2 family peptidyl-tRNA hydrolase